MTMKSVLSFAILVAVSAGACAADAFLPVDTLDIRVLDTLPPGSVVHNALWPSEDTIRARAYTGDLSDEKSDLVRLLKRVMKKEHLPPDSLVRSEAVGIVNLRDESDYLLFHYKTAKGLDIRVMDERNLCLMVTVPERSRKPLSEVGTFVWRTIASVMAFPEFDGKGPQEPEIATPVEGSSPAAPNLKRPPYQPFVFVSPRDMGRSRTGECRYGPMGPNAFAGDDWYSRISWWSDGQRVVFEFNKLTKEEFEARKTMASPQPIPPRIFNSRMPK